MGIYGREGFDLATRWTVAKNTGTSPTTYYVTYLASQIYRNYDGNRSTFGDTSVSASVVNPDNLSSFGAVRSSDGALTVMVINKQQGSTPVTLNLSNFSTSGTAQAWQINSPSQPAIARLADLTVSNNAITTTVPSQSITLFVIPSGNTLSPPPAPTGLAAMVGSGTVTLSWSASAGATGYTVKRSAASGGPYAAIASPTTTNYGDNGVTNGTTYFYVVSATNSAGSSVNSAELAATPIVPPTFTSSASASPNPVNQGSSTAISATVKDTANALTNGNVQILVLDPTGATALTQNYTGQNFASGQSIPYSVNFVPALTGTYTIEVGVFSSTWQQWSWNSSAGNHHCQFGPDVHFVGDAESFHVRAGGHDSHLGIGERHGHHWPDECHCRIAGFQFGRYGRDDHLLDRAEFHGRADAAIFLHLEFAFDTRHRHVFSRCGSIQFQLDHKLLLERFGGFDYGDERSAAGGAYGAHGFGSEWKDRPELDQELRRVLVQGLPGRRLRERNCSRH